MMRWNARHNIGSEAVAHFLKTYASRVLVRGGVEATKRLNSFLTASVR